MIQGLITDRDVLLHPVTIVKEFGSAVLLRALVCIALRRRTTFLALVAGSGF